MSLLRFGVTIAVAFLVGIWIYRDSRGRDYYWFVWTVLSAILIFSPNTFGFLFLCLMIVIYLLVRPKGLLINCPKCGKKIHTSLVICPFCKQDAKRECLKCHEPVPWDAEQCPHCNSRSLTRS